jgi:hypothetical protein
MLLSCLPAGEVHEGDYCQSLEQAEVAREGTDVSIFCYSRMRYVVMQAVATLEKEGYHPEVIDLISLKPFDMATISASVRKTRRCIIVEECMKTGGIGASLSAVINETLFNELEHEVSTRSCAVIHGGGAWRGRGMRGVGRPSMRCSSTSPSPSACLGGGGWGSAGSGADAPQQQRRGVPPPPPHAPPSCSPTRRAQVVRLSSQDVPTSYAYELEAATIVQPEKVADAVRRVVGAPRGAVAA